MTPQAVAIVGSRPRCWPDTAAVKAAVAAIVADLPEGTTVVSGGASGVDEWADRAARKRGFPVEIHPADWQKHGRKAGAVRNVEIVAAADRVIALHGTDPTTGELSGGTAITIELTRQANKPLRVITWPEIAAELPTPPLFSEKQAALVAQLNDQATRLRRARNAHQKSALLRPLTLTVETLRMERDALHLRLIDGWAWLESHREAPRWAECEDRYLGWLAAYTGICDALQGATEALNPCRS